jgi:hypothetical protein
MSRGTALIYRETGEIIGVRSGAIANIQIDIDKNNGRGIFVESSDVPEDTDAYYVSDDGVLTPKGAQPSEGHVFNYSTEQWELDLDLARSKKWRAIKLARKAQELSTFEWNTHTFQCDEDSQMRIQSAVQAALIDDGLSMVWTLADNTTQTFTATQIKQIGQALANHVNACHERGRILRQQIQAATTQEELEAIAW